MLKPRNYIDEHLNDGEAWQVVYYALLASAENDGSTEHIGDYIDVSMKSWDHGIMTVKCYDDYEVISTCRWTILCCENNEEWAAEIAMLLLDEYEKWAAKQVEQVATIFDATCWQQAEPFYNDISGELERSVFQNCVWGWEGMSYSLDYLLKNEWNYGLPVERTKELWQIAYWWVAEGCMEEEYAI